MAAYAYIGLSAGSYTADNLFSPVFSSLFGVDFTGFLGDAAGGLGSGALFAVGSYAFSIADRHTAKLMLTKSALGSAGMAAMLGSGAPATGFAAVSSYAFPAFRAIASGYIV